MEKQSKYLQDEKYNIYCNYNQDNESMEQMKKDFSLPKKTTGIIGEMEDGEIVELWYTDDNVPWDLTSYYTKAEIK